MKNKLENNQEVKSNILLDNQLRGMNEMFLLMEHNSPGYIQRALVYMVEQIKQIK